MTDTNINLDFSFPMDLAKQLTELAEVLQSFLSDYDDVIKLSFDDLDKIFTQNGWFIPRQMSVKQVYELTRMFKNSETVKADEFLVKYHSNKLKDFRERLTHKFPNRSKVIKEAFTCHRKKLYHASSVLFLTQADGLFEGKLFSGKHLKKLKKENEDHYLLKVFHPENPIHEYFSSKNSNSQDLNRHGVMHGVALDYGSKLNSLKALSCLNFMADAQHRFKD